MAISAFTSPIAPGVLAACMAFIACTGDADAPASRQQVVLGTGEVVFEPILGEPVLTLVAGVQGGFHAWASVLAYDFPDGMLDLVLETRVADDPASSLTMRARLSLSDTIDSFGEPARVFAGFPAQVAKARCANGQRIRMHVTLSDSTGSSAEDTRYYIAELAPEQRRDVCP